MLAPFIAPIPDLSRDWNAIGVASLGVLLVLGALTWLLRRRARRNTHKGPQVPSSHEEALAALLAIESSGSLDATDLKPAFGEISEVFQCYIGRRFGFDAMDKTSPEILSRLASVPGSHQWSTAVNHWLTQCDLVKFAGASVSATDAKKTLVTARILIERTKEDAMAQARPRVVARA